MQPLPMVSSRLPNSTLNSSPLIIREQIVGLQSSQLNLNHRLHRLVRHNAYQRRPLLSTNLTAHNRILAHASQLSFDDTFAASRQQHFHVRLHKPLNTMLLATRLPLHALLLALSSRLSANRAADACAKDLPVPARERGLGLRLAMKGAAVGRRV